MGRVGPVGSQKERVNLMFTLVLQNSQTSYPEHIDPQTEYSSVELAAPNPR